MSPLTPSQISQFRTNGYLLLPSFYSPSSITSMLSEARHLISTSFDPSTHPLTAFTTAADGAHVGDAYFLESNTKIHFFLEPGALDGKGGLRGRKEESVNKIGHALAQLNEVFRRETLENEGVKEVARSLGEHKDPLVLQSMIICKQPRIGGQVPCHDDSTFLYTDPPSAIGFWIALEDCTSENGALSFLPGSHKRTTHTTRFVQLPGGGTGFIPIPPAEGTEHPAPIDWDKEEGWVEECCKAGTLVLIHGSVQHRSPPNRSDKTRFIYTFHMIEGEGAVYDEQNWLQPTKEMPFAKLL